MSDIWDDALTDHKRRLRRHIVQTAATLIAERGSPDVPMSLLAARAGIARATLYNYFPDFERVLAALVDHEVETLCAELDRRLAGTTDPSLRLRRFVLTVHDWAARTRRPRPRSSRRALSAQVVATIHEPLRLLRDMLAGVLVDGVTQGVFAADLDPGTHADLILTLLFDPVTAPDPAARRHLVRFVERGLAGPDPREASG
jgi:AcrR family transcriptional regulator